MVRRLFVMLLAVALMASGCVTPRKCLDKFGTDTVRVVVRDTIRDTVYIAGDSIDGSISVDSLQMLYSGAIDSLVNVSRSKDITIKFWLDKVDDVRSSLTKAALRYKATVKPDTIAREVPVEVSAPCPPVVVVPPDAPGWLERLWLRFQFFSAWLVLGGFVFVLLMILLKKF